VKIDWFAKFRRPPLESSDEAGSAVMSATEPASATTPPTRRRVVLKLKFVTMPDSTVAANKHLTIHANEPIVIQSSDSIFVDGGSGEYIIKIEATPRRKPNTGGL
jgi:hypothetical protein